VVADEVEKAGERLEGTLPPVPPMTKQQDEDKKKGETVNALALSRCRYDAYERSGSIYRSEKQRETGISTLGRAGKMDGGKSGRQAASSNRSDLLCGGQLGLRKARSESQNEGRVDY